MARFLLALVALLAIATFTEATLTAQEVSNTLKDLTALSQQLQAPARDINMISAPLILVGQGPFPVIIKGLTQIATTATDALAALGTPHFGKDESASILDAFQTFVKVHQQLLNILIAKGSMFTTMPYIGYPVSAVLRQDESVLDLFGFNLVDICATSQAAEMKALKEALDKTMTAAIKAYTSDDLVE